ncbi:MAG: hypothetical protein COW63_05650 [Bacteroidetes bacterium CG18_big_fil_WC_8_21_14_2_50_41_14]|nr:MAG: hypothetical protein COW63_05650 [Bacteroidetes bacterium CG18_big_fil_WC_8_21_14_2_50_41_14]PJB58801.1 MAG: hypothetical protein CO098_06735 [Bacteroidetes bacterium CG_4_9_14_3_um_filter_41_19]
MKKVIIKTIFIVFFSILSLISYSQQRDPGDPGGEPGGGGEPPLGAPIGSGLYILLGLGAAYGGGKVYRLYQEKEHIIRSTNK